MAVLHPFKAWHPSAVNVKKVSCPPYDVISSAEAREFASDNPESFLHIIRPEIDLPADTAYNDDAVYQKGAENLQRFKREGLLQQDDDAGIYIYQLKWQSGAQTGIFGCVSVQDYDEDVILKHELTRPEKEDDRTRHITTQQAHAEPVMLTFKDDNNIADSINQYCRSNTPLFDFEAPDGTRHRLWKITEDNSFVDDFSKLKHLYIADGHHRCKAASRAAEMERGKENSRNHAEFNYFPAVIFPMSEMNILPYNRLIHHIPEGFIDQLSQSFEIKELEAHTHPPKGSICLYTRNRWHLLNLPVSEHPSAVEQLDVYRLQHFILEPMLGINDPRRDDNIAFVGGTESVEKLILKVDAGKGELAISMHATGIDELVTVSDEGRLMPPKSTWFEPKLRSGLLVHTF